MGDRAWPGAAPVVSSDATRTVWPGSAPTGVEARAENREQRTKNKRTKEQSNQEIRTLCQGRPVAVYRPTHHQPSSIVHCLSFIAERSEVFRHQLPATSELIVHRPSRVPSGCV